MTSPLLKVENLSVAPTRGLTARNLLTEIEFRVPERHVMGIIGESGSGKTLLSLALIDSLPQSLSITQGRVLFRGQDMVSSKDIKGVSTRGRQIGYIGANPYSALDPTMTVGYQLVEKLRTTKKGISKGEAKDRVLSLLEAVNIPDPLLRFEEFPYQYSGGMIQRAMIVDALLNDPDLIIADNVTLPLDVTIAAQIISLFKELREKVDAAFIFISSSLPTVCEIADMICVLSGGIIVERATPERLIKDPQAEYTRNLIHRLPKIWQKSKTQPLSLRDAKPFIDKESLINIHNVHKTYRTRIRNSFFRYNDVRAVRGVSFDIFKGENFGLVGESGCGKSTLSRLLTWLEDADSGEIVFLGKEVQSLNRNERFSLRRRFQLLLQDPYNSIPPHLTVGRTIIDPLLIHQKISRKEARKKAETAMQEVGLSTGLFEELPGSLSAGERQRVSIARALVLEPEIMILDETLTSLDHGEQNALLGLFGELQKNYNFTYIFISHDLAMVRRACDRVAVMYLGEIVELGDTVQIFELPTHPYTQALLSALATLEDKPFRQKDCLLDGEPPSPINLPSGCSFANRCPHAFDRCHVENPGLTPIARGGMRACHMAVSKLLPNAPSIKRNLK